MKDRSGYVYESKGKWIARVTIQDAKGKRRNLKRTAKTKSEAKDLLKSLLKKIESEGLKGIDAEKMTFNDLANYYIEHYVTEPQYYDDRKVSGLRDWKRFLTVNKRKKSRAKCFRFLHGIKHATSVWFVRMIGKKTIFPKRRLLKPKIMLKFG